MTTPRKPRTVDPPDNGALPHAPKQHPADTASPGGRGARTQAAILQRLTQTQQKTTPSPVLLNSTDTSSVSSTTKLPAIASASPKPAVVDDVPLKREEIAPVSPIVLTSRKSLLVRPQAYLQKARPSLSEMGHEDILPNSQVKSNSTPRRSSTLAPIGADDRARAVAEGLPPLVSLATQISTSIMKNIVAYRGSGPIPPGLYHAIFLGTARPKPVTEKAKSSTFGPMEGYAVQDPRNGRYEKDKDGNYALRPDQPPELDGRQLDMSLRDLFNAIGTKYQLLDVADGVIHFCQNNHPHKPIKDIVFSINLKEAVDVDPEIVKNYRLISSHFDNLGKNPTGTLFEKMNLDSRCPVYVQHPGDSAPQPIIVLGDIVRGCDIDTITNPPDEAITMMLGAEKYAGEYHEKFLRPLDMSSHLNGDKKHDLAETVRAQTAIDQMVESMLQLNQRRWDHYNSLKSAAKHAAALDGAFFDLQSEKKWKKKWEIENIHLKPFVREDLNIEVLSAMVVTVGKGTPMQLYQGLEINIIEKNIFASQQVGATHPVKIADLDSYDSGVRNAALRTLHKQKIPYNKDTIARAFIQHPSECHNEYYTCPRGPIVMVNGRNITLGGDTELSKFVMKAGQYQPINPKWINERSLGNENAAVWVKHFLANYDRHYKNNPDVTAVKQEVDLYLGKDSNKQFVIELQKEFNAHSMGLGVASAESYLKAFHGNLYDATKTYQQEVHSNVTALTPPPTMGSR